MTDSTSPEPRNPEGMTRAEFARLAVGTAAAVGLGGVAPALAAGQKPRRGGTLRLGAAGGGPTDTIDAHKIVIHTDVARIFNLYDPLVGFAPDDSPVLQLAQEVVPTKKDATEWTIRLKRGLEFHNGKDVTADDVIFTLRRILDPKNALTGSLQIASIDPKQLKKIDKYTVRVGCKTPFSTFYETLPNYFFFIIPVGYDPKHPVGTGPFKFKSFTPGQQSVFTRFENYWQTGKPYADSLVITDIADEQSAINALLSGQVDMINFLSAPSINALKSSQNVAISNGAVWTPFTMRVDVKPFNDVRVRQAFKLMVDREQMRKQVFGGYGLIGNDLFSPFDYDYNHSLPQRKQDLDKAKSLLKQAGQSNLSVELVTANIASGAVESAQVLAQQAKGAGVKVSVRKITEGEMYGPNYLKWPFAQDQWLDGTYFPFIGLSLLPGAAFNETHFANPRFIKLYNEATRTLSKSKRREIAQEMQAICWREGGYIIPFFSPTIDAYSKKAHGYTKSKSGTPFGNYNFKDMWLA
jgi:peptide/nickel transport system substrate-binding protein